MARAPLICAAALLAASIATSALAQAPRSTPATDGRQTIVAACTGPAPSPGQSVSGPVLEVLDGRTICVAQGDSPDRWVRIQLTRQAPDRGRGPLLAASFAKPVTCVVGGSASQGVIGRCAVEGVDLGELLARPDIAAAGEAWR